MRSLAGMTRFPRIGPDDTEGTTMTSATATETRDIGPFAEAVWDTPFGLPPFERIRPEHYLPAFEAALDAHDAEIAAIAGNTEPARFANTVEALERAGLDLDRVASVFFNLSGSNTSPELQAVERAITPRLARHGSAIYLNPLLWARISAVDPDAEALGDEERRVLDRYRTRFRRAGADLAPEAKTRMAEIAGRMAELGTTFSQNLLADEGAFILPLDGEDDLAGLPEFLRSAAASAAKDRGDEHAHIITLSRSLIEPFLVFSTRRDLREKAYQAWIRRGESGGATDNRAIIAEIIALRAERARLLGFDSFAHFKLSDTMAGSPDAAMELLRNVWTPAHARAGTERDRLPGPGHVRRGQYRPGGRMIGATMPRSCGGPSTISTRARSSPTCPSMVSSLPPSTQLHACSTCASRNSPTFPATTPMCEPGWCAMPTGPRSASSSAIISRGLRSAAVPG